ncbi:hypothetical protein CathTA2_1731 [Caldalkalibacillus thermarum TA2.A1]|uniref:Transcription regulator TrmB N-terminal domain-containing protein n=1 Tax=Caldalkalibacillus thermarum (strain TA2.A1) TaxID=986075 RepID=F5L7D1_CALTT|nr:helix-turn-helix domain-containing protein [Caldalkalibacillus thermarum]EGL82723.1 hypothetical protein CathTA2_1731 [Caldalkalibacillus thermarum TA2.A1]QZT32576.1 hypothetical protein HUR95_09165 [Caldalkalibacillus thermarum TA2.A1]
MPCTQPESFLSSTEIRFYLQALLDQPLTETELSKQVQHPLFKVRSTVRELARLGYVQQEEHVSLTEKGLTYLRGAQETQDT